MDKGQKDAFVYGGVAVVLLLCLFDMPYGFYSLVRFSVTTAFCYLAFKSNESGNKERVFLFIILATLFQPFFKIPLGRVIWNIVDVVIAAFLIYLLYKHVKEGK
ncbi:MAG: hypothetical protein J5939_08465 [Bacteroidales bacterium]|nr:hypothetical protein [Bacteroidales bacterium]